LPLDQLHDEIGEASISRTGIEDAGDTGVIHDGQGLAFLLKAGQNGGGIHAGFEDLDGNALHKG
jgi:hypothetical protein